MVYCVGKRVDQESKVCVIQKQCRILSILGKFNTEIVGVGQNLTKL